MESVLAAAAHLIHQIPMLEVYCLLCRELTLTFQGRRQSILVVVHHSSLQRYLELSDCVADTQESALIF